MPKYSTRVRNPEREARLFKSRAIVALLCCALGVCALLTRAGMLQLVQHDYYVGQAKDNRMRVRPIPPTRGMIYDRKGRVLAENLPTYQMEVMPELISRKGFKTRTEAVEARLDEIDALIPLTENERKRFKRALSRYRIGSYKSIALKFRLTEEEVAQFSVNRHALTGVDIVARLNRNYPYAELTAHTVGYVGRVDERDLKRLGEKSKAYEGSTHTGKTGIERFYESELHGEVGNEQIEVNVQGRVLRVLNSTPPVGGQDIYLTLDIDLQKSAYDAFEGKAGALVALEPKTGEVLAMVSAPGYDPNLFVNGISVKDYQALRDGLYLPLFNRALKGRYPPGSTVKPFIGLGGAELGVVDPTKYIPCYGFFQLPNDDHKYRDWKRWGHGLTNLDKAITQSCDVYFYDLANRFGIDRMHDYMVQFGFGQKTGLDLLGEGAGLMPSSKWKKKAKRKPWFPGETLIAGIGQGYFVATPVQLAVATSALANNGYAFEPHLLKSIKTASGVTRQYQPDQLLDVHVKNQFNWDYVKKAMEHVVHSPRGTAKRIGKNAPYRMAGKTGTAQVFSIKQDERYNAANVELKKRDHALFVSWAPVDDPKIVVALIVENGGSGSAVAAPIARKVMDRYLLGDPEQPAPDEPKKTSLNHHEWPH